MAESPARGAASVRCMWRALAALACVLAVAEAHAEEGPLWEAGLGLSAVDFPHYRGSDQRSTFVLPVPYFVYRGEFVKADRGRLRGLFFDGEHVKLDVSANASIPVDSDDNRARQGMPDLDPTLELGPNLEFMLYRSADRVFQVDLRLPMRTVIATDFSSAKNVGWVFQPQLNVDVRNSALLGPRSNIGVAAGPMYGDKRHHNYFFGVPPAFAAAERPAYAAEGGYAGIQVIGAASKRFGWYWVGGFVRWDTLSGAVFDDSPLVRRSSSLAAGAAIVRVFGESSRRVRAD
jgi:outer membrane scaffolding protein for murein synthesis (MipA/OmpV family)